MTNIDIYSLALTNERQQELKLAYERNTSLANPPYWDVVFFSADEIRWVMLERDWSNKQIPLVPSAPLPPKGEIDAGGKERADFRGIYIRGVDLSKAELLGTNFSDAHLEGTILSNSDLRGAIFTRANLSKANLRAATLRWADFRNADLREASLQDADLRRSQFDGNTKLTSIIINSSTLLADVLWNGAMLTRLDWESIAYLGDEKLARQSKGEKRKVDYREAVRAYQGISIVLSSQGMDREASRYRLREKKIERKLLFLEGKRIEGSLSWLSDVFAGYGERTVKPFSAYFLVIVLYGLAYYLLGSFEQYSFTPLASLVFSITSFHGRGFFPNATLTLDNPITVLAATEAIVGLLIELILIGTFSRRFLESR